jgi:uncharacterized protein (DUF1778 family)
MEKQDRIVSVRFEAEEAAEVRVAAFSRGVPVSTFIKESAVREARRSEGGHDD